MSCWRPSSSDTNSAPYRTTHDASTVSDRDRDSFPTVKLRGARAFAATPQRPTGPNSARPHESRSWSVEILYLQWFAEHCRDLAQWEPERPQRCAEVLALIAPH